MVMLELSKSVLNCVAALKAQLYAAVSIPSSDAVDLPDYDAEASCATPVHVVIAGDHQTRYAIRSLDDYAGRLTENGLGSLDIGGGRSRFDE